MLLINGERKEMTAFMKKQIFEACNIDYTESGPKDKKIAKPKHASEVRVKYLDTMIKKNRKDPRITEKPASLNVQAMAQNVPIQTEPGDKIVAEVIYYEGTRPHDYIQGEKQYDPSHIEINDGGIIYSSEAVTSEQMLEMLWFLQFCCPQNMGGANANMNTVSGFVFINERKEADDLAKRKREELKIEQLLWGDDDKALGDVQLRTLAKTMFISNTERMTENELRKNILVRVEKDKKHRETLLDYHDANKGESRELKEAIQEAVQGKIIGFDGNKGVFGYIDDAGKVTSNICVVKNQLDENARLHELFDHLWTHTDQRKMFLDRVSPAVQGK